MLDSLFNGAPVSTKHSPNIDLLYKKICELVSSAKTESIGFAHGYIVELLHWVCSQKDSGRYWQDTTIQKVLNIISEKKGITSLDEISEALHMNKFYVCHMFKNKTGRTPTQYRKNNSFDFF